jgi:hypothetical protein
MKASLHMLLIAAVAALALFAHKGGASPAQVPVVSQKPPVPAHIQSAPPLRKLVNLVDEPEVLPAGGVIIGGVIRPFPPRPQVPVFSDIGTVADLPTQRLGASDTNLEAQLVQKELTTQVPAAGIVFQVADMLVGGGNAAGVSPQQLTYIRQELAKGVEPGRVLALAEGRLGAKQVLINGDYVTVGGAGLGGPGLVDADFAVADEQRSLRAAPARLLG